MLNYRITGQGDVLLLIHGFCENLSLWGNVHSFLPNNTVLAIDLPGFGDSPLSLDMSISSMSNQVHALLEQLNITKCTIVGHSLGGYVALDFAERFAEKVSGLGLFHSTAFEDSEEKKENRNKTFTFIEKHGVSNFANSFVSTLFYPQNRNRFETIIEQLTDVVKNTNKEAVLQTTLAMRDRKTKIDVLKNLTVPVLFIVGKEDQAVPMEKSLEQCYLPKDSIVHLYDNTAHMGMFEKEKETNYALKNFMNYVNNI
tara:strand:- start:53 stop:820 length:768 start_codon:yes stop_codon:yes gene_type:complete